MLLTLRFRYLREIGSYNGALELVDIGLTLSGGDHEIRIANLVNIGGIASERLLQLDQARKYYERALEIRARILGDGHQETCGMKQNLACVTAGEGQYGLALQLFEAAEKGITMSTPQEKRLATHRFAANYGRCLIRLGEFEKARENLVRGREILDSGKDVPIYRRSLEYCFGNLNLAEKRLDDAKVNYQTCLTAFPDHILGKNQRVLSCGCHYKLARIAMEQGDFDSARYDYIHVRASWKLSILIVRLGTISMKHWPWHRGTTLRAILAAFYCLRDPLFKLTTMANLARKTRSASSR